MMKRILFICLAALWLIPGVALAHSKIEVSVPAKDATVNVSPEQIEITFNTKIEKLSNFKLLNAAGEEVSTEKTQVSGSTMSGAVPDELPNGVYTVKWTIIGADGHSVEGDYAFTVEAPVTTPSTEPTTAPTAETPAETATPTPEVSTPADNAANNNGDNETTAGDKADTNYTPAIVIGVIIVAAAVVLLLRRRK